jgi:2-dehydropantoate 2-reductase
VSWTFGSVAIVGSGAIGLYYGGRLAAAGENVKFLLRSDFDDIQQNGLRCESIHGDFALPEVQGFRRSEEIGPVDLVIVAWKATANSHLADVLPPLLHADTQVLTCKTVWEIARRSLRSPERIVCSAGYALSASIGFRPAS